MMDNLRTASSHIVLKIILGLIIVSFVLTGVGNYLIGGNSDYAAKVNGTTISRAELENAFNNERNREQQQLGAQFSQLAANPQFMQQMRQQAMSDLIDQTLMQQYVKSLNLDVSDAQIKDAIFAQKAFQTNGQFDNARFNSLINNMGYTADQYAAALRKSLVTSQIVNALTNTDFMLKNETQQLVSLVAQTRDIREAAFNTDALAAKQTASDDEISSYYQQHKDSFMTPEQFRVSYIELDASALQKTPTQQQVQAWYDSHKSDYTQEQQTRFSVIQVKTEADAQAILAQLKQGADFATLAKEKSIDAISARKGGDMGWLEQDTLPDELKNAGLTQKGQLSGVIKSSVGYLIARLDDIHPEQVQPLSAVYNAVAQQAAQDAAVSEFYKLQQKVSDAASNNNTSLAGAESAAGVKSVETDWFSRDSVPAALNFDPVKQVVFGGTLLGSNGAAGSNSDIITVDGDRAFVVRISDHKPEAVKPLDQVKAQIADRIKHDKAMQLARTQAASVIDELKAGKTTAFDAAGLKFGASETLSRNSQNAVTAAAFELPQPEAGKPAYGVSEDMLGNVVILSLDKVTPGTLPAAQVTQLVNGVTQNNAQLVFAALLQNLRHDAKIKFGAAAQSE
ncbi:peptidylprolyl isomerase [Tatumella ptyseos]|uniref:Periplasmic chaperone PpiD n=2 Tax=Tatumella ptyseos TaxID=82987 RepID=A0A085JAR8_9GAMM|nr:peptidylprolyl isomerase [Tatumella ptyseos]KFD17564.1 peptidyl-prolyl cis-trans isomerase [Tatumella ptyseos ATCC 33301]SQK73810.1 Peptidyl-prolyl cis-trans isomerase D [Tatumella ptyseos]